MLQTLQSFAIEMIGFCIGYNATIRSNFIVDRKDEGKISDKEGVRDNCCGTFF
jgi:hypothetical protein